MRDGGGNHPFVEPIDLTSAWEIMPHETSQEEKGVREKKEGARREGRKKKLWRYAE
jgi:hypothetical protein